MDNLLNEDNSGEDQIRFGKYKFPEKECGEYEGWWKFGKIHGEGVYKFCGNTYTGDWEYNQKSGIGTLECVTGEVFHGEWKDDFPSSFFYLFLSFFSFSFLISLLHPLPSPSPLPTTSPSHTSSSSLFLSHFLLLLFTPPLFTYLLPFSFTFCLLPSILISLPYPPNPPVPPFIPIPTSSLPLLSSYLPQSPFSFPSFPPSSFPYSHQTFLVIYIPPLNLPLFLFLHRILCFP